MKIFIGNATKQNRVFAFRAPESKRPQTQEIAPGGQVMLTGDFSAGEIEEIISQHRKYGLVEVKDIDRSKSFSGYCYSIDKPIRVSDLQTAMVVRNEVLVERGRETRTQAALAINDSLNQSASEDPRKILDGLNKTEISISEDNFKDNEDRDPIAEGVRVDNTLRDTNGSGKGKGSKGKGGKAK